MISFPNAKINLGLNVVFRRADGYHNIETIFYPVQLKDALEIVPMETDTAANDSNNELPQYRLFQSGISIPDSKAEDNLVIKALNLVKRDNEIPPIDIYLFKNIPLGAGLGGGSANAASMLTLLNNNFELGYSETELMNMASILGADCPFFIKNEPAFATGIGDILEPVSLNLEKYRLVLVKPDIMINTAQAYSMINPVKPKLSLKEIIQKPVEEWKELMNNDFESPIFNLHPQIGIIKNQMYDAGALYASMSGSGSTVYALFDKDIDLEDCFEEHFVWINNTH